VAAPKEEQYVLDNYRRLALVQLNEAPAVFSAFLRQIQTDEGRRMPDEILLRSYYAFTQKHGRFNKIQLKDFEADRTKMRALITAQVAAAA
jgi:hypothetical protein